MKDETDIIWKDVTGWHSIQKSRTDDIYIVLRKSEDFEKVVNHLFCFHPLFYRFGSWGLFQSFTTEK